MAFHSALTSVIACELIDHVLDRIRGVNEIDYKRILFRVSGFHPLDPNIQPEGTEGLVVRARYCRPGTPDQLFSEDFDSSGRIDLLGSHVHLLAILSHELGHACTRCEDVDLRDRPPFDRDWAREACADYYAFRWGFRCEIEAYQRERDPAHHTPLPGEWRKMPTSGGSLFEFTVTDDFRPIWRRIRSSDHEDG